MHRTREWGASDAGQSLLTQAGVSVQAAVQRGAATCRAPQMSAGSGGGSGGGSGRGLAGCVWAGSRRVGPNGWAGPGLLRMAKMPFFVVF